MFQDDVGLEWLDLTHTANRSVSEVSGLLGAGQEFEGWRLPTDVEVEYLMDSIFSSFATNDGYTYKSGYTAYSSLERKFRSLFGTVYHVKTGYGGNQNQNWYSYGAYMQDDELLYAGSRYNNRIGGGSTNQYAYLIEDSGIGDGYTYDRTTSTSGVFLVSDGGNTLTTQENMDMTSVNPNSPVHAVSVSEPPSAMIGLLGLAGLAFNMRRRRNKA